MGDRVISYFALVDYFESLVTDMTSWKWRRSYYLPLISIANKTSLYMLLCIGKQIERIILLN